MTQIEDNNSAGGKQSRSGRPRRDRKHEVSKEQIVEAVRKCAESLGRQPRYLDLVRVLEVEQDRVVDLFGSFGGALRAAGLRPHGTGYPVTMEELFADWSGMVRSLGKIPTLREYKSRSHYSVRPLRLRFGAWENVAKGMLKFSEKVKNKEEWKDVLDFVRAEKEAPGAKERKRVWKPAAKVKQGRPQYGHPLLEGVMATAPVNEMGVMFLFASMARRLGFIVLRLQPKFPDCEALHEVGDGRWEREDLEFEFESRTFVAHRHDAKRCDRIVCWRHNWKGCPIEVLELSKVVGSLPSTQQSAFSIQPQNKLDDQGEQS